MQDKTAGIWVKGDSSGLSAGDEVAVEGRIREGVFSPVLTAISIRKLGTASLPRPVPVTYKQLASGDFECQYVSITGVVRSVGLRPQVLPDERLWVKIEVDGQFIYAALPEKDAAAIDQLIDSQVRVEAVATSSKNRNQQIIAPILTVASAHNVTLLKRGPQDLFALPVTPIGRLMQYRAGIDYDHRVRVAGTVTYSKSGDSLILQDPSGAILILTDQHIELRPGDRVEASGFPTPKNAGPVLEDSALRIVGHGLPPVPRSVPVDEFLAGAFNNSLVSIQGRTVRRIREPNREILLIQADSNLIAAELPSTSDTNELQNIPDGSTVNVSGVSVVQVEGTWFVGGSNASIVSSIILLRSPTDVKVLKPPSWWNARHLIYLAIFLAVLLLAVLALVVYKQMDHWRLQAVLKEREWLANEMHDTLAQSFAGIGFQLQAIRDAVPDGSPRLRKQVDVAWSLVRHSHKEARRSIEPLSIDAPHEFDLLSALVGSAKKMVGDGSVEVNTESAGPQRAMPPHIYGALLRIGQEAIANAVRHADPRAIGISVSYSAKQVRLAVQDDGCGFVMSASLLGFGLRGMRKRAAAIGARIEIVTEPGFGTCLEVMAPLPPDLTPSVIFKRVWKHVAEMKSNAST